MMPKTIYPDTETTNYRWLTSEYLKTPHSTRIISSPHGKSFLGVTSRDGFSLETNTNAAVFFVESTTLLHPDRQSAFLLFCSF
jgi:hypothetical protein